MKVVIGSSSRCFKAGLRIAVAVLSLGVGGCARFPDSAVTTGPRFVITLVVDGAIRFGSEGGVVGAPYVYMVALNPSELDNPTTQGPIPVIAPPWGNGFVAGNATHFVLWDPTQASPFTLYRFTNAELTQWAPVGVPVDAEVTQLGTDRLRFEIELRQLVTDPASANRVRSVQMNFLTMDRVPQTGTSKFWDALGDGRFVSTINTWVTIPTTSNATYDNLRSGEIEPRGDQPDPDLDLIDWSVDVRTQ